LGVKEKLDHSWDLERINVNQPRGGCRKIGIEYSVHPFRKAYTQHGRGCSWAYSIPAIGQTKNMKLAVRALTSNREESDLL